MSQRPRGGDSGIPGALLRAAGLLVASAVALGCSSPEPGAGKSAVASSDGAGAAGASGTSSPPPPVPAPWAGWHRWPYPPDDCNVFVPDDLGAVEPLVWEPCPFMPDGCTRAGAPWAEEAGWGYGGLLAVSSFAGAEYSLVSRAVAGPGHFWETLLYGGEILRGAWRSSASAPSRCVDGGAYPSSDGRAAIVVIRADEEPSPWVFLGPLDTLWQQPERTEIFGPPDAALFSDGRVSRSDRLLMLEHYATAGFTVRDLHTGQSFEGPWPASSNVEDATVVGDRVYFWLFGALSSVWIWRPPSDATPLLQDDGHAYANFATDGHDAAWIRASGITGFNKYASIELWTSPLADSPAALQPKKLASLPFDGPPLVSVGEGWVAIGTGVHEVEPYRIADGARRALPAVDELYWHSGQHRGLVISGGAVWVKASLWPGGGADVRFITRFDLDKLPAL